MAPRIPREPWLSSTLLVSMFRLSDEGCLLKTGLLALVRAGQDAAGTVEQSLRLECSARGGRKCPDKPFLGSYHSGAHANDPEMGHSSSSDGTTSPGFVHTWKRKKQKIPVTTVSLLTQNTQPLVLQKGNICFLS